MQRISKFTSAIAMSLATTTGALAAPYSDSMAECAALYQNAAQWVETDAAADKLMFSVRAWTDAAIAQASAEGIADAETVMMTAIDAKTDTWEAKSPVLFATEEFRDWMDYCRSFAANQGIEIED